MHAYPETIVCKFGGDPTICLREVMVSATANSVHCAHCGQTDCNTSLPPAGEVIIYQHISNNNNRTGQRLWYYHHGTTIARDEPVNLINVKQESPADARVTRDSAVIPRWRLFQDGGQPSSWILSNRKQRHSIRRPRKPLSRTTDGVDQMHRLRDIRL